MPFTQAICVLIIRLWAIGLIPYFVSACMELVRYAGVPIGGDKPLFAETIVVPLVYGATGVVAFICARWIASGITKFSGAVPEVQSVSAEDLVAIGSFLIGLFFLLDHLAPAIVSTARIVIELFTRDPGAPFSVNLDSPLSRWLNVIIGLFLTFRPYQLARLFAWLRSTRPAPSYEEQV